MIDNSLLEQIAKTKKITKMEFLEKDLLLHVILQEISNNAYLKENLIFKGGTCLTKCYLGYFRFSEDLDFTWKDNLEHKDIGTKKLRAILSIIINEIGTRLETIAKDNDLDFKSDKSNKKYFQFGGTNKFTTFKLWYYSNVLQKDTFIKIQINFIENLKYPITPAFAKSIINSKDLLLSQNDENLFTKNIPINCYDIKEILLEKNRAILTRRGLKARDFVDVYLILKYLKEDVSKYEKQIVEKTKYMLDYEKYGTNLKAKKETGITFTLGEEQNLLLKELDDGFEKFIKDYIVFLNKLLKEF